MVDQIKELVAQYWVPVISGGGFGFLLKSLWDLRFKTHDRLVPMSVLIDRQLQGQLGTAGQRRLRKALADTIRQLAERMPPGSRPSDTTVCHPGKAPMVLVHPSRARENTLCPVGNVSRTDAHCGVVHIVYLRVDRPRSENASFDVRSDHVVYGVPRKLDDKVTDTEKTFLSLPRQGDVATAWLWVTAAAVAGLVAARTGQPRPALVRAVGVQRRRQRPGHRALAAGTLQPLEADRARHAVPQKPRRLDLQRRR